VRKLAPYLFVLPALALLVVFVLVPMAQVLWYSLLRYSFFGPHEFVGFDNYARLLGDSDFWWTLLNSALCVLVTPALMVVSLVLALNVRERMRRAAALRLVFFLPVVTPIVVVGIIWRWILAEETGLANYLLSLISIGPVPWLTEYPVNILSVLILTLWRGFGYYMMLFLAGLALLPREVEEAGMLDGAGPVARVWHILLPALTPTLLFMAVVSASSAIKIFTEVYVLIPGVPMSNKTLVALLYRESFERFDFGYGSAIAVVLFALTFALSYANIRIMEREA
jgi:putative chitobiose transport system permease protein